MPTTYSTNLKLALMATGENNNVWGIANNTNIGTLLEQAIVGSGTVAMADANQTVTIVDGTSSTGRNLYLKCTGVLTAARTLTVPTVNKNYIIDNATTGGYAITVKTAAGTGISVAAGTKRAVYADGTNVVDAFTAVGALTTDTVTATTVNATTGNITTVNSTTGNITNVASTAITTATLNKVTVTAPATAATLTIANNKTFTVSNTITLQGTDGTTFTFPGTSGTVSTDMAGEIRAYAFPTAPAGWLLCNGQAVSRTTYSALNTLMSANGYPYGSGDGSTTFNVPDLRGRVLAGSDTMGTTAAGRLTSTTMTNNGQTVGSTGGTQTHTLVTSEIPSHTHPVTDPGHTHTLGAAAGNTTPSTGGGNVQGYFVSNTGSSTTGITVGNTGGGGAHLNTQPTMIVYWIIKT